MHLSRPRHSTATRIVHKLVRTLAAALIITSAVPVRGAAQATSLRVAVSDSLTGAPLPGTNVTVLVYPRGRDRATAILFRESTTLGIRTHAIEREVLERRLVTVRTRFGEVPIKEGLFGGKVVNVAPEFEDCRRIARAKKVSLKQVQQAAIASYHMKGKG